MPFWEKLSNIVCPCIKSERQVLLEEIVVEESCEELRQVVVES
jgi:hypothetical protein